MIVLVEGPRGAGKSHLIDNFFAQNEDDRFLYYKWNFAEWVNILGLEERGSETHYLSLANILTILEMGNTMFKDKILVLDRSIFSNYVWAVYRNRIPSETLTQEFLKILSSSVYKHCKLIYLTRDERVKEFNREHKDIFDKYENYRIEKQIFDETFTIFNTIINNSSTGNSMSMFNNQFDIKSQFEFNKLLNSFVDK